MGFIKWTNAGRRIFSMLLRVIDTAATGRKIHRMCSEAGLTVNDIRRALHLESAQGIYKWFSPKSNTIPSLDHLVVLARMLDCHIDDLLVIKEEQVNEDDQAN
jgi:hypothetical protein